MCVVYTDNNLLGHLATVKVGAIEQWWTAQLAAFNFDLKYRRGRINANTDALSRLHPPTTVGELGSGTMILLVLKKAMGVDCVAEAPECTLLVFPGFSSVELESFQAADSVISEAQQKLSRQGFVLLWQWKRLMERDKVLYQRVMCPDSKKDCVPFNAQNPTAWLQGLMELWQSAASVRFLGPTPDL